MTKNYVNGKPQQYGEMTTAKSILISLGIYKTLGNYGAYTKQKADREGVVKHIETFVKDGFEFRVIESKGSSFSLASLTFSEESIERECWYQPI